MFYPETEGKYDVPVLKKCDIDCDDFIAFNSAKSCMDRENVGVHFFIEDYQFSRIWNRPTQYMEMLKAFKCVCSPDYSLYSEYPLSVKLFNNFKNHWLGAYWQDRGIPVIPTITWDDKNSYDWCFDGFPTNSCVAVSSVGTQKVLENKLKFLHGYSEMVKRLSPTKIFFWGKIPDELNDEKNIIKVPSFCEKVRKRVGEKV